MRHTMPTIATLTSTSQARGVALSRLIPIADADANVQAWIKTHPTDAAAYCTLGRIHALAWAYGNTIPLLSPGKPDALPTFSEFSSVLVSRIGPAEMGWDKPNPGRENRPDRPVTADDAQHLTASIAAYRKAIDLNPKDALSELALAWMLTQQGQYARALPADFWPDLNPTAAEKTNWTRALTQLADADPKTRDAASATLSSALPNCIHFLHDIKSEDPETKSRIDTILLTHFELQALAHYRKAFDLKKSEDLNTDPTYDANTQISAKAATQILSLLSHHPNAKPNEQKTLQKTLPLLQKKLDHLNSMPQ